MIKISSAFDGGAIEIVAAERCDDVRLNIRADSHAEFRQWFYFRLQGASHPAEDTGLSRPGPAIIRLALFKSPRSVLRAW